MESILYFIRYLLVLLFVYTAYHKLIDLNEFEVTLYKSELIMDSLRPFLKYFVPLFELLVALLMLFNKTFLKGLYLSLITLVIFTIYFVALNNFSFNKGCSCGGIFNKLEYSDHLIINFIFIALNSIAIVITKKSKLNA